MQFKVQSKRTVSVNCLLTYTSKVYPFLPWLLTLRKLALKLRRDVSARKQPAAGTAEGPRHKQGKSLPSRQRLHDAVPVALGQRPSGVLAVFEAEKVERWLLSAWKADGRKRRRCDERWISAQPSAGPTVSASTIFDFKASRAFQSFYNLETGEESSPQRTSGGELCDPFSVDCVGGT